MPYVIVKMYTGRDEQLKSKLADALFVTMQDAMGVPPQSLTIDIQERERPKEGAEPAPIDPRADEFYYRSGKKQH